MTDRAGTLLGGRRERLVRLLGRPLGVPGGDASGPTDEERREYLLEEARDLYWNDLEWEHVTGEEEVSDGQLVELAFPGFLAFVRGLLLQEVMPDAKAPPQPRPEVVEQILGFLADRVIELEDGGGDGEGEPRSALEMTSRLVDLVLYQYHGLTREDVERVEAAGGATG